MNAMIKRFAAGSVVAVTAFTGLAAAPANANLDRHVKIINETRSTLNEFYASNINRTTWEEDILGQDVLRVGESVVINIDDGTDMCLFDFKGVFADGDSLVRRRINVCTVGTYRYTED